MDFGEQIKDGCPAFVVQQVNIDTKIDFSILKHGCNKFIDGVFVFVSVCDTKFLICVELGICELTNVLLVVLFT